MRKESAVSANIKGHIYLLCAVFIILVSIGGVRGSDFVYKTAPSCDNARNVLVGANYFNGWWEETPNKWQDDITRNNWLENFPQRRPLLGEYNSQEVMDKEIKAASEYGIDFFQILWYFLNKQTDTTQACPKINKALDYYVNSPNANTMRFSIEFCNSSPFEVKDFSDWDKCIDIWLKYMKHPAYLRVGGKAVFKVHSAGGFWGDAGGFENAKKWIAHLRERAKDAGIGELLIGCGSPGIVWEEDWPWKIFDYSNDYMRVPEIAASENDYPFDVLAKYIIELRGAQRFDKMPLMPFMAAGWNPRPWKGHAQRPSFTMPTRQQWVRELERTAFDIENMNNMSFPIENGQKQKIFVIYAWNEYGEGGILAPTQGEQYMKLEGIRQVFGVKEWK